MRMTNPRFSAAIKRLPVARRDRVKAQLAAWKRGHHADGVDGAQIARNIESEQGMSVASFAGLLGQFGMLLERGTEGVSAWREACEAHSLAGARVPPASRPVMLGRAAKLGDYATHLQRHCSSRAIDHALLKNAGKASPSAPLRRQMTSAKLSGGRILWATFSPPPDPDPFSGLPLDTTSVRTALGLGFADETTPFILLQYRPDAPTTLPLYRPTVADAGSYHHFRPHADPSGPWGLTHPLPPNPRKFRGRPEVVHQQIVGKSLVFPYLLTST